MVKDGTFVEPGIELITEKILGADFSVIIKGTYYVNQGLIYKNGQIIE